MDASNSTINDGEGKPSYDTNQFQHALISNHEVEEAVPAMRHVALGTARNAIELPRPSWSTKPIFPTNTHYTETSCREQVNNNGLVVAKEWIGKLSMTAIWDIKDDALERVPLDFPLARTHREIYGCLSSEIAIRISNALRELSIEAEYDNKKAKAKCRTCDFVSFRIRLYAGGEGCCPVIVEVQKRNGQSMSFMQNCRAILGAAEGQKVSLQQKKKLPPFLVQPVGAMKCLKDVILKSNPSHDAALIVKKAIELLQSSKRDENLLGMENLCHLTDPCKTAPETASCAAICVVIGDEALNVRDEVEGLLQQIGETREFNDPPIEGGVDYSEQIHHHALRLFSNSLILTEKAGVLRGAVTDQSWFGDHLIPTLLREIHEVKSSPNNACISVSCLNSLLCSDITLERVLGLNGMETLQTAKEIGDQCHELLAIESERCIKALQNGS